MEIQVQLSGSTLLGRGWDQKLSLDPNDPEWNQIAQAINAGRKRPVGAGYTWFFSLDISLIPILIKDLQDNAEIYKAEKTNHSKILATVIERDIKRLEKTVEETINPQPPASKVKPDDPVVTKRLRHPMTNGPCEEIFIIGKGWFQWNTVYHVYNSKKNYEQLHQSDVKKWDWAKHRK